MVIHKNVGVFIRSTTPVQGKFAFIKSTGHPFLKTKNVLRVIWLTGNCRTNNAEKA